jgi:hypothetical protein
MLDWSILAVVGDPGFVLEVGYIVLHVFWNFRHDPVEIECIGSATRTISCC